MAKGSQAKEALTSTILSTFPGSFIYGKEIRIPYIEDGENIQIKVSLTCAKENVEQGGDTVIPGVVSTNNEINFGQEPEKVIVEPTQEEKENVKNLLKALNL